MKKCEDCGKTLGILTGYSHPTMGKSHLLCSNCFDQVSASVEEWKEFVISNSFNNGHSNNSRWNLEKIAVSLIKKRKMENKFLVRKEA
jgi:hypothetical protein